MWAIRLGCGPPANNRTLPHLKSEMWGTHIPAQGEEISGTPSAQFPVLACAVAASSSFNFAFALSFEGSFSSDFL